MNYIETTSYLVVNREKTKVDRISRTSFWVILLQVAASEAILRVHTKSRKKMKARLKELTNKSNGWSYEYRKLRLRLRQYITG